MGRPLTEAQIQSGMRRIEQRFNYYRAGCPARVLREKRHVRARRDRIEQIIEWLSGLWYGATRPQLIARFSEFYPQFSKRSASERKLYRDFADILATGKFVRKNGKVVRADRAKAVLG